MHYSRITATGESIWNRVAEVRTSMNLIGENAGAVTNIVSLAASDLCGDMKSQFNFVMVCLSSRTTIGDSLDW